MVQVAIDKLYMGFRIASLHRILAYSKGQGQGHAHFDNEVVEMATYRIKITIAIN